MAEQSVQDFKKGAGKVSEKFKQIDWASLTVEVQKVRERKNKTKEEKEAKA